MYKYDTLLLQGRKVLSITKLEMKLSEKQIMEIPERLKLMNVKELAKEYKVNITSIYHWIREYKKRGVMIDIKASKKGRPSFLDKVK